MERIPANDPWRKTEVLKPASAADELDGMVDLGMRRDALRLARRLLQRSPMTAKTFNTAVNAVQTMTQRTKSWARLVESAYERLPKRDLPAARFCMIGFRSSCGNHEGVIQLRPRRFLGVYGLSEMAFVMESMLALNRMDLAAGLARRSPRAIRIAKHPLMKHMLRQCLGEYFERTHSWDKALAFWEKAQGHEALSQNAVVSIVEIHAARALLAIKLGFQLIEQFNRSFDPEMETALPGYAKWIQQDAAKKFGKLEKILERIVFKERQRELRIDRV